MKIYVGNLSFDASEDDVREAFEEYGNVSSVSIITDRDTGRSRGFAFVEMPDGAEAKAAIEALNLKQLHDRSITVNEAREMFRRRRRRAAPGLETDGLDAEQDPLTGRWRPREGPGESLDQEAVRRRVRAVVRCDGLARPRVRPPAGRASAPPDRRHDPCGAPRRHAGVPTRTSCARDRDRYAPFHSQVPACR